MLPPHVNILGREIPVYVRDTGDGIAGTWDFDKQCIEVSDRIHPDAQEATLLHEVIEAGNELLAIGLSERQIVQLETLLHAYWRDNGDK